MNNRSLSVTRSNDAILKSSAYNYLPNSSRHFLQQQDEGGTQSTTSQRLCLSAFSTHSKSCDSLAVLHASVCSRSVLSNKYIHKNLRSISATNCSKKKTKNGAILDRFIPCRSAMNMDVCGFLMTNKENNIRAPGEDGVIDEKTIAKRLLLKVESDVLQFRPPVRIRDRNTQDRDWTLCSSDAALLQQAKGKHYRYVPNCPERILDAPNIRDDFYIQLIDWSYNNIVGLVLDNNAYLWNATTHDTTRVCSCEIAGTYFSGLSFLSKNDVIALSTSNGKIEIRDYKSNSHIRCIGSRQCRVATIAWNNKILASGCRKGQIHLDDVRCPNSCVLRIEKAHREEVCAVRWSPCRKYLASGGNDNQVHIWDFRNAIRRGKASHNTLVENYTKSMYSLPSDAHNAAVKAIAWCPWQPSLLATAGGASCRSIRVTNINNKETIASIKDTRSQITGLIWSDIHRELLSSHGQDKYQLTIWRWPNLVRICELFDHSARIIGVAQSPDGQTVVSAGGDETLRFWNCFKIPKSLKYSNQPNNNYLGLLSNGNNFLCGNVR
ncbi:hypothetical protein GJ496_004333 [Pomphorhynchus laevis]|nr:hypothetical protein GJ496_004333 [Pomphorhynchus laevis]